jgi:hypothetical protein
MSNINIKRAVENIRTGTTIYTPVLELTVNGIDAVRKSKDTGGLVKIVVLRSGQSALDDSLSEVVGFRVEDDGVGFNEEERRSFDTLYSDLKEGQGGKGFGRFTCLKYFENLRVKSVFRDDDDLRGREFHMGHQTDIIVDETLGPTDEETTGSRVTIDGIRTVSFPDKKVVTIAKVIFEKLLPFFVDESFDCPRVIVTDGETTVSLNDYLSRDDRKLVEISPFNSAFEFVDGELGSIFFRVRVFKVFSPRTPKSKVALVAHRREVTETTLQAYIPEFAEEFYEPGEGEDEKVGRNYIVKAYVFSEYLDENVLVERAGFRFSKEGDMLFPASQSDIEKAAAQISKEAVGNEIAARRERKLERIADYVDSDAPWHKQLSKQLDFEKLSMSPSSTEIELYLQEAKHRLEVDARNKTGAILSSDESDDISALVQDVVKNISSTGRNDLIHYVSLRKCVLDIFQKSLGKGDDGKYSSEAQVHSVIMPRFKDSDELEFSDHNLWLLDERLNFARYVASDKLMDGVGSDRTDISVFDKRVAFRGDNESTNPITIFEFKKPKRHDFADRSSKDDPVQQIIRYVNEIRDGKHDLPDGREILVSNHTPFYGYVVCDFSKKVKDWLEREKNFTPMPDGLGYFQWFDRINLYMEVLSWTKVLRDAQMRNRVFFHKLGI